MHCNLWQLIATKCFQKDLKVKTTHLIWFWPVWFCPLSLFPQASEHLLIFLSMFSIYVQQKWPENSACKTLRACFRCTPNVIREVCCSPMANKTHRVVFKKSQGFWEIFDHLKGSHKEFKRTTHAQTYFPTSFLWLALFSSQLEKNACQIGNIILEHLVGQNSQKWLETI